MIGLIVSGHLNFASGMASAVKAIAGEQQDIAFIDFLESISPMNLKNRCAKLSIQWIVSNTYF